MLLKSKIQKHKHWFVLLAIFLIFCFGGMIFTFAILTPSHHNYQIQESGRLDDQKEAKTGTYYVYGGAHGLPLCSAPSPYSKIIDIIPDKMKVKAASEQKRGYYKVQYGEEEGYVKGRYLITSGQKVSEEIKQNLISDYPLYQVVSDSDTANLYQKKTNSSNVIAKITIGYRVRLLEKAKDGYVRVSYKNQIGYMESKYLKQFH